MVNDSLLTGAFLEDDFLSFVNHLRSQLFDIFRKVCSFILRTVPMVMSDG